MRNPISEPTHLQSVTFELHYPTTPFYPSTPVFAQFSGVLNPDSRLFVRLDSGSIPDTTTSPGIPIRGLFTIAPGETPWHFSGFLSNNRIQGKTDAQ